MVCIPCIVIPILLWIFHKFIQPWILKFWNPAKSVTDEFSDHQWPPEGVDEMDNEYQYIKELVSTQPVMVFSKTTCSYSKMAKEVLDKTGVEYVVEELDGKDNCSVIQDMLEKITGARTVPRVFINKKCIGGGSETYSLYNHGKLLPLLQAANAKFLDQDKKMD